MFDWIIKVLFWFYFMKRTKKKKTLLAFKKNSFCCFLSSFKNLWRVSMKDSDQPAHFTQPEQGSLFINIVCLIRWFCNRKTKVLIRPRESAGWFGPFFFSIETFFFFSACCEYIEDRRLFLVNEFVEEKSQLMLQFSFIKISKINCVYIHAQLFRLNLRNMGTLG